MKDPQALNVFFSYAHQDEELRDELDSHFGILKRGDKIRTWHDREILPGGEWAGAIDHHLEVADVILLLVSPAFIASDYCWDVELKRAMERHRAGEARVIPIILRPVDWQDAPFGKLQALPEDARPVTTWPNRDLACLDVARGLRSAIEELRRPPAGAPPAVPGPAAGAHHSPPSGGTVRARSIKARNVAGVRIQGADAETAARLAGAGVAGTGIAGQVVAEEIDADNVTGLQLRGRSEVENLEELRRDVAALRRTIEQLVAAGAAGDSAAAGEARDELATASDELAGPRPAGDVILPKLERAAEILDQSARNAEAAGKLGTSLDRLAPAARALWHAASTWLGI